MVASNCARENGSTPVPASAPNSTALRALPVEAFELATWSRPKVGTDCHVKVAGALYSVPYFVFATHWWQWMLLPLQWVLGPIHGAIVNWCGHKYGYRNFQNGDGSRNTLVFDMVTMGELFQNNHHKYPMSPDFAARWFEIDPTWQVLRVLAKTGVIEIATPQRAVHPARATAAA